MKALILVGGYGTRLRPLTLSCPKPMIEFCNKPLVLHQIEALIKVGVDHVILAVGYKAEVMEAEVIAWEKTLGIKIETRVESTPLGTAGPLAFSADVLDGNDDEPFFVLNSDIVCQFPLAQLAQVHASHGMEGTVAVTTVKDPSKYGVLELVETTLGSKIGRFIEKPSVFVSDKINAGIYMLSPRMLRRIQMKPTSIEREIFPKMAEESELYAYNMPGFWMDVGQPKDFLEATRLWLEYNQANSNTRPNITVHHPALIADDAVIGDGCEIGPNVTIGSRVTLGTGVRLVNSVILNNVSIGDSTFISGSIIGWNSQIGRWARIEPDSVIALDVRIADEVYIKGCTILPNKEINSSYYSPSIIM